MFRGILKNPAKQRRHMNENTEFFLQNSVSNPCTSREIPDSESDTSKVGHLPFYFKNQPSEISLSLGITADIAWPLFILFMTSKVASPSPNSHILLSFRTGISEMASRFWVTHWEDQGYKEQVLLEQLVPRRGSLPEWPTLATCSAAQPAKHN